MTVLVDIPVYAGCENQHAEDKYHHDDAVEIVETRIQNIECKEDNSGTGADE